MTPAALALADATLSAFGALLVIGNVLPFLPFIQDYTSSLPEEEAASYTRAALLQGNLVGVGFVMGAPALLAILDLGVADLQVAGGVVLLTYATHDILFSRSRRKKRVVGSVMEDEDEELDLGAPIAPLGVPILVGPGTLSLLLVLAETHGPVAVLLAMSLNFALNLVCLRLGPPLLAFLGDGSARAIGKVMSLILATVGAGMLRAGVLASFP